MGSNYFSLATEVLEKIQEGIDDKYITLAYLRTFLGEHKKAKEVFELIENEEIKSLAEAYIALINRDKKRAIDI